MCRVFGVTLDDDDDDHEADHTSADDSDDEQLNADGTDNPTNLFSSATGQWALYGLLCVSEHCINDALFHTVFYWVSTYMPASKDQYDDWQLAFEWWSVTFNILVGSKTG